MNRLYSKDFPIILKLIRVFPPHPIITGLFVFILQVVSDNKLFSENNNNGKNFLDTSINK